MTSVAPDLILTNGRITTLDRQNPSAEAVAVTGGVFTGVGSQREILPTADANTRLIDLGGRRVIPGLIDSHTQAPAADATAFWGALGCGCWAV